MKLYVLFVIALLYSHNMFGQWGELGGTSSVRFSSSYTPRCDVYAITMDDSGNVFTGGSFTKADSTLFVAKYDKASKTWSELGSTLSGGIPMNANGIISKLCADRSGNIYALNFDDSRTYLYRWDKLTNYWTRLDSLRGAIDVISDKAGNIYVNDFDTAQYIKKWGPAGWSRFGPNVINATGSSMFDGDIQALAIDDSDHVFVAKDGYVLKGNGVNWVDTFFAPGVGIGADITAMTCDPDGNVYFAIFSVSGSLGDNVFKIDTKKHTVAPLCGKAPLFASYLSPNIYTLKSVSSTELYVGGFGIVFERPDLNVAKWNSQDNEWHKVGDDSDNISGLVNCMFIDTVNRKSKLLIGGYIYDVIVGGMDVRQFIAEYTQPCNAYFTLSPASAPHSYTLTDYCSGSGTLKYLWTWGDGKSDTGSAPTHTYDSAGIYQICVSISDSAGCSSSFCNPANSYLARTTADMVFVNVARGKSTGINEHTPSLMDFTIYPNPSNNTITVSGTCEGTEVKLSIKDLSGKQLMHETAGVYDGHFQKAISLTSIASGIYIVELQNSTGYSVQKLSKR